LAGTKASIAIFNRQDKVPSNHHNLS